MKPALTKKNAFFYQKKKSKKAGVTAQSNQNKEKNKK